MNLPIGIIVRVVTGILLLGAYYFAANSKPKLSLLFLCLGAIACRLFVMSDAVLHLWDERYHALVAKHMMTEPYSPKLYLQTLLPYDYTNWTTNHIWLHKQPLPLWAISGSFQLFGINHFALRLPSLVLTTIGIILVYKVCFYLFKKEQTSLFAAFLFSVNGYIIELTGGRQATDHPDVFFMFFILLGIYYGTRFIDTNKKAYNILVGVCLGAALLSKWLPAFIIVPVWFLLVWDSKKYSTKSIFIQLAVIILIGLILFLPWQLYIHHTFPKEAQWETSYNSKHFFETLEGQYAPWYYFLDRMRIDYGELIYVPVIWLVYTLYQQKNQLKLWGLFLWFLIPIVFFSFAANKMQGYILISAPALMITTAGFYSWLKDYNFNPKFVWFKKILLAALFLIPLRYCLERCKFYEKNYLEHQWVTELQNWEFRNDAKAIILGYSTPIEAMFYTNATVYREIPSVSVIEELIAKGYHVFIQKKEGIDPALLQLKAVSYVQFKEASYLQYLSRINYKLF